MYAYSEGLEYFTLYVTMYCLLILTFILTEISQLYLNCLIFLISSTNSYFIYCFLISSVFSCFLFLISTLLKDLGWFLPLKPHPLNPSLMRYMILFAKYWLNITSLLIRCHCECHTKDTTRVYITCKLNVRHDITRRWCDISKT